MPFNKLPNDGQPKPGTGGFVFSHKRFEEGGAYFIRYTGAIIRNNDLNELC